MKIGLVCPYNVFKGGGVQECVFAMQAELNRRGHKALIVTPQPRHNTETVPPYVRLLGRSADVKSPFHTTAQISVSVDVRAVDELLAAEKFDILHFHEPWVPLLSWQMLQRSQAKNIATFHAKLPDTFMAKTIERVITPYTKSVLKYLNALTAVSQPAAGYVNTLSDRNVSIIPNGIDLKKYKLSSKLQKSQDSQLVTAQLSPTILYIGRLERRKGLKYLLEALRLLQRADPDITCSIAGAGPDRWKLENMAKELGVHAEFLGRIDEATKKRLLANARVFCTPAQYGESFGIVLLEAMACSLPVVAGNNPGYQTVLSETGSLSLVDASDVQELARKLDLFIHDDSLRGIWQNWAKQSVKQYDYQTVIDRYEALYGSL